MSSPSPVSNSTTIQRTIKKAKRKKPRWTRGTGVEELVLNYPQIADWYRGGHSLNSIRIALKEKKIRCCRTTIQSALVVLGLKDELAKRRTKQK